MSTLRQRKGSKGKETPVSPEPQSQHPNCCSEHPGRIWHGDWSWGSIIWTSVGWSVSVGLGLLCCIYVATLHENDLWFANIKEVEREISFRTECGLYYSYYKQMLQAPSISAGLSELIHDNLTESKRTINLLQRMNIYQEVFLSVLYRLLPVQSYLEPIYFYIYTVFSLQAVYVMALYLTAWLLSGSWMAGALTGVWYILNRIDTTRVEFTISLRENWSLPFFALQVATITCYLRPQLSAIQQKVMVWLMYVTTFCFCVTWQFNQFIILVQALIIYTLDCTDFLSTKQVTTLYLVQVSGLLSVWLLQFCNSMILGSLVLSFIVAALFVRHCQTGLKTGSFLVRVGKLLLHTAMVLLLTFTINYLAKDEYIWTGHMCAVAAFGVCGTEIWTLIFNTLRCNSKFLLRLVTYAVPLVMMGCLYHKVYQVYARRSPEDVHHILRAAGADYVVLENSICYERRHRRGCRLRDLLDLANGHIMDGPGDNDPDLAPSPHPRFCEGVKTDSPAYNALFSRTFQNKTFHVYKLKKKRKKSPSTKTSESTGAP
ncbi:hypothetical protein WMY93_013414 [Mugilogobius chulae]|uniref:C-mannosyltransferase DPY19L3 n=1 Tax=Mugilogobius chulae TaxID=88201 RepID=A0AAW0P075_9GOBI